MEISQPLALMGRLKLKSIVAVAAMVALAGTTQAALVSLSDNTVKDTNTNLIWLKDWNVNGQKDWGTQKAWAEGLTFADSSDWVLPSDREYSALFEAYGDLTAVTKFTNVRPALYWAGESITDCCAYDFHPGSGIVGGSWGDWQNYAVAVRPGDVAAVPEPQTLALALLALGATVVARRRRSR